MISNIITWLQAHTWICVWGSFSIAVIGFVLTHILKKKKESNQQQIGNVGSNSTVNQANGSINIGRNEHDK